MGNKFSSWKRNKGSNARMGRTASQGPLVISLVANSFKNDPGKESERKPLCAMFDYLFKDSGTYEIVQPSEEFHIGTDVIQPPVIEIGGSQATRHPAINYKSFKTDLNFLSFSPWHGSGTPLKKRDWIKVLLSYVSFS